MHIGVTQEPGRAYQLQNREKYRYEGQRSTNSPGLDVLHRLETSVGIPEDTIQKNKSGYSGITDQWKQSDVKWLNGKQS